MRVLSSTLSAWKQHLTLRKDDAGGAPRRIDASAFRQIMREVAAPVAIIAAGEPGQRNGLTATAICSVSDNPPTVLTCVNQNAIAHGCIIDHGCFSINFLSSDQEAIAVGFSGANKIYGEDRFALGDWTEGSTGAPLLRDTICSLECKLIDHTAVATHTIFVGELISARTKSNCSALLYQHGAYKQLAPAMPRPALADCQS